MRYFHMRQKKRYAGWGYTSAKICWHYANYLHEVNQIVHDCNNITIIKIWIYTLNKRYKYMGKVINTWLEHQGKGELGDLSKVGKNSRDRNHMGPTEVVGLYKPLEKVLDDINIDTEPKTYMLNVHKENQNRWLWDNLLFHPFSLSSKATQLAWFNNHLFVHSSHYVQAVGVGRRLMDRRGSLPGSSVRPVLSDGD